jgi:hypothetical protein
MGLLRRSGRRLSNRLDLQDVVQAELSPLATIARLLIAAEWREDLV